MKIMNLMACLVAVIMITSCFNIKKPSFELELIAHYPLEKLPSASGVFYHDSLVYIVGDDSPMLFLLNDSADFLLENRLSSIDSSVNGRTPKKIKADYESMELVGQNNKSYLLVLSSGSKQDTRDTAVLIGLESSRIVIKKNLRSLYEKIKETAGISENDEINIEGLAVSNSHAYLLHRGNISGNFVVSINKEKLINYILGHDKSIPELTVHQFHLPEYQGAKAGFSGACMMPDNTGILFSASLEDTDNVYDDGQIKGSYIGIIPLLGLQNEIFSAKIVHSKGHVLEKKLEGLTIKSVNKNKMVILSVADNDDGTSDLYEFSIVVN